MTFFFFQIEDLSQQAQVAAAEKFKEPPVIAATEAGGSTTVMIYFLNIQTFNLSEKFSYTSGFQLKLNRNFFYICLFLKILINLAKNKILLDLIIYVMKTHCQNYQALFYCKINEMNLVTRYQSNDINVYFCKNTKLIHNFDTASPRQLCVGESGL